MKKKKKEEVEVLCLKCCFVNGIHVFLCVNVLCSYLFEIGIQVEVEVEVIVLLYHELNQVL